MAVTTGQLLFPVHILHALNAVQHLRAMLILSGTCDKPIYSSCDDVAREIGAPRDSLWRTLMHLGRAGLVETKKGPGGGYHITALTLHSTRVVDILQALGKALPDNGDTRGSDRLQNTVADCLNLSLEEFFR